jgi:4-hydroxybenzoate polyprenyltransferase
VRLIHPFPTALNALASVLLAVVAAHGWPGNALALRLAGTMLAVQSAIGIVNDIVDRELDAAAKPWKPIPSGAVPLGLARGLGALAILAALLLGASLGLAAFVLSTAGMCVGLAYDRWLKRSAFSSLTYAVALPLVPLWVWTAQDRFTPSLLWVWPLGLVLGGALQLLNALPDLETDAAGGVHGTAQRLGRRDALIAGWGGYLVSCVLALGLGLVLGHERKVLLGGTALALMLLAVAVLTFMRRPGAGSLQLGWNLLAPGAGVLAVSWLAAMP